MAEHVNINIIQYISILGSISILVFILELIRKKKLKEEYSLIWLFFSIVFLIFSFWRHGLEMFSRFIGIDYPPSALFLILIISILSILVYFSIIISKLSEYNKELIQTVAILDMELKEIKKHINR